MFLFKHFKSSVSLESVTYFVTYSCYHFLDFGQIFWIQCKLGLCNAWIRLFEHYQHFEQIFLLGKILQNKIKY